VFGSSDEYDLVSSGEQSADETPHRAGAEH